MSLNKHIRFDDDESNETSDEDMHDIVEDESDDNDVQLEKMTFNAVLAKDRLKNEKSFGFQLKGNINENGNHCISVVEPNSPSQRAKLKPYDKIIKVNGFDVKDLNINGLIQYLEYETSLNEFKLVLTIERTEMKPKASIASSSSLPVNSKRILSSDEDIEKNKQALTTSQHKDSNKKLKDTSNTSKKIDDNMYNLRSNAPVMSDKNGHEMVMSIEDQLNLPTRTLDQLRAEKIEEIKFVSPERPIKRFNVPSKVMLNLKAREIQERLSEQGKYVNWKEIIYELLQLYDCKHIGNLDLVQADHLETIYNLMRLQKKVDTFIITYETRVSCLCFLDMEESLIADYNYGISKSGEQQNASNRVKNQGSKITRFEELYIGPLIKNQLVRQIFKIPDEITSIKQLKPLRLNDVISNLHRYLEEKHMWNKKIVESDFETYILSKYKISSMASLCVKINNIGLMIGTIKNVQHSFSNSMRETKSKLNTEFDEMCNKEKISLLKFLAEQLAQNTTNEANERNDQIQTRIGFLNKDPISVIDNLINIFDRLMDKNEANNMKNFLYCLRANEFLRSAFHLIFCVTENDLNVSIDKFKSTNLVPANKHLIDKYLNFLRRLFELVCDCRFPTPASAKDLKKFLNRCLRSNNLKLSIEPNKTFFNDDSADEDENSDLETKRVKNDALEIDETAASLNHHKLNRNGLTESLANFIQAKLEPNSTLEFDHLIKLESELYGELSNEFMDFLSQNRFLFEKFNLNIILLDNYEKLNSTSNIDKCLIKSKRKTLHEFVNQCKFNLSKINQINNEDVLKKLNQLICTFYSVQSLQQLGIESIESLTNEIKPEKHTNNQIVRFVYQDAIIFQDSFDEMQNARLNETQLNLNEQRMGIIDLLNNCPLLENVYEYLDWYENYFQTFGHLKEFLNETNEISANLANMSIDLLELEPHTNSNLLKITRDTNVHKLKHFIEVGDFLNASGHLVSLISIKYNILSQAPSSLIANEIESSLSVLQKHTSTFKNSLDEHENSILNNYFSYLTSNLDDESVSFSIINKQFYSFLIEFICKIPFKLIKNLLLKYIVEPLIKLEGDHDIKHKLFAFLVINSFLSNYKKDWSADMMLALNKRIKYFIKIGNALSINEWSLKNFKKIFILISKLSLDNKAPKEKIKIKHEETVNETINNQKVNEANHEVIDQSIEMKMQEVLEERINVNSEEQKGSSEPEMNLTLTVYDEQKSKVQFEHVNSIRQRYGIDIELSETTRSVTDSLKGVIGRSLQSLSNELYNKDMHFVLELIQNADDNSYGSNNEQIMPTLVFLIEPNQITLFNNEVGFEAKNINAICDVKASTKGKHQRGYIGRKGIGFKSVFTVTDRPEIHSNDYHIKFDLSNGHIGYILPNWISDQSKLSKIESLKIFVSEKLKSNEISQNLNTIIQLPLKSESEMQRHKSSLLTNNFNDIKPYLLLFLNRLRNLVIIKKNEDQEESSSEIIYQRVDLDDNLIEIKSNSNESNKSNKWLVVRETLKVPDNLKPSEDVDATDLCFAFPIDSLKSAKSSHLPRLDVFAYLPLRSFGFSFIIQADFVVPASRQDINQDNEWNQFICKQIPDFFIKSLGYFNQHKIFNADRLASLKAYLRFIPLEEEIVGFFQHIPRQILDLLRNEEFLPAVDPDSGNDESSIVWKKPFECVIVQDEFIRQTLTSDLLKKYLGRYYLHSSLLTSQEINQKLLFNLGVRSLGLNDLLEILKTIFSLTTNDFSDVRTTAKWLVVLEHCLKNYSLQQEEKFLAQIKQLEFIPIIRRDLITNQIIEKRMVSLDKTFVFFPLAIRNFYKKTELNAKKSQNGSTDETLSNPIVNLIERDLNLLDIDSLICLDHLKNAQIVSLLKNLGVKLIEPKEILDFHIYQKLSNENIVKSLSEDILVLYLIYIHDLFSSNVNYNAYGISLDKLKEHIIIKTNKGLKKVQSSTIYLTKVYGNKYDLKAMFPSYDWCLLDSIYHSKTTEIYKTISNKKMNEQTDGVSNKFILSWRKFFIYLGLNDSFMPRLKQTIVKSQEISDMEAMKLKIPDYFSYLDILKLIKLDESFVFNDYECDVFDYYARLAEQNKDEYEISEDLIKQLTNLFRLIEENWDHNTNLRLSSFKYVSVGVISNKKLEGKALSMQTIKDNLCETAYYCNLKTKPWICTEVNEFITNKIGKLDLLTYKRLDKPSNVFLREQIFLKYYERNVPYCLNAPIKDKSSFGKEINLKYDFNFTEFLSIFSTWITKPKFNASIAQMKFIYESISNKLNSYETKHEIKDHCYNLFESDNPLIFIPDDLGEVDEKLKEKVLIGTFYSSSQVYWHDPTRLFSKYKKTNIKMPLLLENIYYDKIKGEQMKQIFLNELKITITPRHTHYLDLLEHIAKLISENRSPFTYEDSLRDVYIIFELLVDKCIELSQQISLGESMEEFEIIPSIRNELLTLIQHKPIIPCLNNKWLSLFDTTTNTQNYPIIVDTDYDLAEKFIDQLNMVVIPPPTSLTNESFNQNSFNILCKSENLTSKLSIFFQHILQLNSFSQVIVLDLENITESLREAPLVQNICRNLLPVVQCFMFYRKELRQVYEELKAKNKEKLTKMKFYSVRELQNIYKCILDPKISVIVSNKTCLDTNEASSYWKYYVRADMLENDKEIIKGFCKLFSRNVNINIQNLERNEKDLFKLCLLMHQFSSYRMTGEDKREIERDYNISLSLPNTEIKWEIPEAAILIKRDEATSERVDEIKDTQHQKIVEKKKPSSNTENTMSKRQQYLQLEKLSQSQINDPLNSNQYQPYKITNHINIGNATNPSNNQNSFAPTSINTFCNDGSRVSEQTVASVDRNLQQLAHKMSTSFSIESCLSEKQTLLDTSLVTLTNIGINASDWPALVVDKLNNLNRLEVIDKEQQIEAVENDKTDMMINTQFKMKIGQWGELFIYEMLKKEYEQELRDNTIRIEWMNETVESGLPYDFRIRKLLTKREGSNLNEITNDMVVSYIEVKSTSKSYQEMFNISFRELLFAEEFAQQFEIYRLYNACSDDLNNVRVKIIKNIPALLNSHAINLYLLI